MFNTRNNPRQHRGRARHRTDQPRRQPQATGLMDGLHPQPVGSLSRRTLQFEAAGTEPRDTAVQSFNPQAMEDVTIEDVKYVGSYNMLNESRPTILVPGSPPEWKEPSLPVTIQSNASLAGNSAIPQDHPGRFPSARLLPLFVSADALIGNPSVEPLDWPTVDIVCDRNALRKLLRWAHGPHKQNWRMDLQLAGTRTALLSRQWEHRANSSASYDPSFDQVVTASAPGCEDGALEHIRIISYNFSGLKMVVASLADACYPEKDGREQIGNANAVDQLAEQLGRVTVSPRERATAPASSSGSAIHIRRAGRVVPQSDLIELKICTEDKLRVFHWAEAYPQILLSQTPHHLIALRSGGTIRSFHREHISSDEMRQRDKKSQPDLKVVRAILETVRDLLIRKGRDARLSLVCQGGALEIYERVDPASTVVPIDVLARFEN